VLIEAWSLLPIEVQAVFLDAESKLGTLNPIDLGPKRSVTVGESALWSKMCGVQFAAQIAAAVSLEEPPTSCYKAAALAKEVGAIRYSNITPRSITKFLESPVTATRPQAHPKGHQGGGGRRSGGRSRSGGGGGARGDQAVGRRLPRHGAQHCDR